MNIAFTRWEIFHFTNNWYTLLFKDCASIKTNLDIIMDLQTLGKIYKTCKVS